MDFMEAMVCAMAVTIVIGMYLAMVSVSSAAHQDLLDGLDKDSLEVDITCDEPVSRDYLTSFILDNGLSGISVRIDVPLFWNECRTIQLGDESEIKSKRSLVIMSGFENGRNVMALLEVTAFI